MLSGVKWGDVHLVMLIALQDGTKLETYPFDMDGEMEVVKLNAGDIFVFRGDLIHAGAEYTSPNYRIHFYIDSPTAPEQRIPGKPYLVRGQVQDYWPLPSESQVA